MTLLFKGAREILRGFGRATALKTGKAQPVKCFWVSRAEPQCLVEALLRRTGLPGAQLRCAEFQKPLWSVWTERCVHGKFRSGSIELVLPQPKAAKIEADLAEVMVEGPGSFVGPLGFRIRAGVLVCNSQIIPCQRVRSA